jgi:hypothetical protein
MFEALTFAQDGAQRFAGALTANELATLVSVLAEIPAVQAGMRLHAIPGLTDALGAPQFIAEALIGKGARAVRAVLFDKTADANWSLAWHQDRTIVVRERRETPGFGPWSMKQGLRHVEPPFDVLVGMATLRVHIDAVGSDNAPLIIARGSHRLGRVPADEARGIADQHALAHCLAEPGDV